MAEPSPEAATWRREASGAVKAPGVGTVPTEPECHCQPAGAAFVPLCSRGARGASRRIGHRAVSETGLTEGTREPRVETCLQECCPLAVSRIPGSLLSAPQDPKSQSCRDLSG